MLTQVLAGSQSVQCLTQPEILVVCLSTRQTFREGQEVKRLNAPSNRLVASSAFLSQLKSTELKTPQGVSGLNVTVVKV